MKIGLAETDPGVEPVHAPLDKTTDFVAGGAAASKTTECVQDMPQVGDTFGGYRLLSMLGQGGMGAVFEAEELDGGRLVALKLLKKGIRSTEAKQRFFREGRIAASINHPNSVYVFGAEEIDGIPAISMERVTGGTLDDLIKAEGPLLPKKAVDAILQIIDGLEAAAELGILHRDVKPSNCFVDAEGVVKVGDFGLSISTAARGDLHLTTEGSFLGTPAFSSPEQLRGDALDERSDIYAVGVTLYYLLTGETPFVAVNMVKLLATVLEQSPPSPRERRPEIPKPLAATVLKCLAKQPASRFKDYGELRAALEPFGSKAPTPASLGLRALACVLDFGMLELTTSWFNADEQLIAGVVKLGEPGAGGLPWELLVFVVYSAATVLYFAVCEGVWGFTPGKWLCGLRVLGPEKAPIGVGRATGAR